MQPLRTVRAALVSLLLVVPLAGCGGQKSDLPELGEVTGIVTVDDKPTAELHLTFEAEKGRPSAAITGPDGRYELVYKIGTLGAAVGAHTVRISKVLKAEELNQTNLPKQYNEESTLKADVKKGKQEINFDLKTK